MESMGRRRWARPLTGSGRACVVLALAALLLATPHAQSDARQRSFDEVLAFTFPAEGRARQARRLRRLARDGGREPDGPRRTYRVLDERLQRAGPPDGHRSLSDCQAIERLSGQEHPADPGRVRAAAASRGRAECDARSDRAVDPARVPRSADLPALGPPRPR